MKLTAYVQRNFDSKQVAKFVLEADETEPWAKSKTEKDFKKMLESKYKRPMFSIFTVGVYTKNS